MLVRFIEELAGFARVIMLDKRGTGLSDRVREVPTLETRMDDLRNGSRDSFYSTRVRRDGGPRTTRGRSPTPSGGTGWPRSVWAGGEQSSSMPVWPSGRRDSSATRSSARGFSGTCVAA